MGDGIQGLSLSWFVGSRQQLETVALHTPMCHSHRAWQSTKRTQDQPSCRSVGPGFKWRLGSNGGHLASISAPAGTAVLTSWHRLQEW